MEQLESYVRHGKRAHRSRVDAYHGLMLPRLRDEHGSVFEKHAPMADTIALMNQALEGSFPRSIRLFFDESGLETEPVTFPEGGLTHAMTSASLGDMTLGEHLTPQVQTQEQVSPRALADAIHALAELVAEIKRAVDVEQPSFGELAAQWKSETAFLSAPEQIALHPGYQRIMALGPSALPDILRALRQEPDYWFWALRNIVGVDIAEGAETVEDAARSWVTWGERTGIIE